MSYHLNSSLTQVLSGTVPRYPFSWLPSIIARARDLLRSRSNDQIEDAALSIDWAIEDCFRELKEREIGRLRQAAGDRGEDVSVFDLTLDADDLDLPTRHTTSQVDALKECIDLWDDIGGEGFPNAQRHEFFAVLSLSLVGGAVSWLLPKEPLRLSFPDGTTWEPKMKDAISAITSSLSLSGECAIEAMDAVCYAEHLRMRDLLLENTHSEYKAQETQRRQEEHKQKQKRIEPADRIRHRLSREAKQMAIAEWEKDPSRWPSTEQAGNAIADWLESKGYDFVPRTVTGWIGEHKKKTGGIPSR
jgi:hypothetical protein